MTWGVCSQTTSQVILSALRAKDRDSRTVVDARFSASLTVAGVSGRGAEETAHGGFELGRECRAILPAQPRGGERLTQCESDP